MVDRKTLILDWMGADLISIDEAYINTKGQSEEENYCVKYYWHEESVGITAHTWDSGWTK